MAKFLRKFFRSNQSVEEDLEAPPQNHTELVSKLLPNIKRPSLQQAFKMTDKGYFFPSGLTNPYVDTALVHPALDITLLPTSMLLTMLDALRVKNGKLVLDIGCGTGYSTCLLAQMVGSKGKVLGTTNSNLFYFF